MNPQPQQRLLMIDDDRKLCALVRDYLEPMGFAVDSRHSGDVGLQQALEGNYEAVILDVMMPGMNGVELLKALRKESDVPVLMLTALGEESDRIVGLEIGADDYLPKTFSTRELLARIRAVTRRGRRRDADEAGDATTPLMEGPISVNIPAHTVVLDGKPLEITALEFSILVNLMKSKGRVKTREALIEDVSDRRFDIFDRSIDVHISSLRKKLGDDPKEPRFIRTVRGVGYTFGEPGTGNVT
jgi:two-component system response regulator CpxR